MYLLERVVEADRGGRVEDDGDLLGEHVGVRLAEVEVRQRDVAADGDDAPQHARVLAPKPGEHLEDDKIHVSNL